MYAYTHDSRTGGLLLNSSPSKMSKEPRPVYAPELDVLGFDRYWSYDKQSNTPYMWAEANRYIYRGRLVAMLKGGNLYQAPEILLAYECKEWRETQNGKAIEKTVCDSPDNGDTFTDKRGNVFTLVLPEPIGKKLRPIDIPTMVEANRELLQRVTDSTAKRIVAVYEKYADKLDIFHVAFSGGKDSCVLLDLVKKSLPHKSFVVVFGDTLMEFPDTYDIIDATEAMCKAEDIPFYRAKSHLTPMESWELFGPPSRTQRWCCSVHKSTPQILKLREVTGKLDYTGLDYVGVRAEESLERSKYEYENYGKKIKGQRDHYSILEWTSAEVWIYIFANDIPINTAYKKGNPRAGCLFCPMAGGVSEYIRHLVYSDDIQLYIDLVRETSDKQFADLRFKDFMNRGAWKTRGDGRYIAGNSRRYSEEIIDGKVIITVENPLSNWKEWIKTLQSDVKFDVRKTKTGFVVSIDESEIRNDPSMGKIFRQVFRKAAYCSGCGVCAANCKNGRLSFEHSKIKITDCLQCLDCHKLSGGCLMFDSLKIPNGGHKMRAINSFNDHAPKTAWMESFFKAKEAFFTDNDLGPDQKVKFKVFLTDVSLAVKGHYSTFAELIAKLGWDTDCALGLMIVNLAAYNPQFAWYIKNLEVGQVYPQKKVIDMLQLDDVKETSAKSVAKSFKRIVQTPFGTKLNWGYVTDDGDIARTVCTVTDPRVILYGLYVYNEKANTHYEFRLSSLYENVEQDGISPTQIFGLDRQTMIPILNGLTASFPDYINATFTNDLDKISLMEYHTPADVLKLFEEGN